MEIVNYLKQIIIHNRQQIRQITIKTFVAITLLSTSIIILFHHRKLCTYLSFCVLSKQASVIASYT